MTTNDQAETLVAYTAREIVFSRPPMFLETSTVTRRFPAGTEVYATVRHDGIRIRVCGTLYTQDVALTALIVP
jgi:hypothetical protein